jgi:cytosine permease
VTASEAPTTEVVDPDYPVTPVPAHARKSFFSIAVVLLGFTVFTPTMLAGATLGPAFAFDDLVLVILAGSLILGAYVAVMGWVGARTGLTTVVMARYTLGTRGAKLASILLGGTQIGWYGVVVGTIGDLTAEALDWRSYGARAAVMVLTSGLMCATAYWGYRGMYWVSLVSTPLILVLAFWVVGRSLQEVGGLEGLTSVRPTASMAVAVAITTVVGTFVSAGTQAPNWTRFARRGSHAVWACVIGFLVGNGLMVFFGAIGALTFGEGDFVLVLYQLGLVGWGLVLLFGNLWKSNADTAYAFGVAGAELFDRPSKGPFVIGGAVIGTVLAHRRAEPPRRVPGAARHVHPPAGRRDHRRLPRPLAAARHPHRDHPARGAVAEPARLRGGRRPRLAQRRARHRHPTGHRHRGGHRAVDGAVPGRVPGHRAGRRGSLTA